jgi:hypothetical protein
MYLIEWLKDGTTVDRETSLMLHEADVVAAATRRVYAVVKRLDGKEPDSFKLTNSYGMEVGVFKLDGQPISTHELVEPRSIVKVCGHLTPITMLVA